MKVVAKSLKGHEYMYSAKSAHKVPNSSAQAICDALNECKYKLKENEVWFIHEVDRYDNAYEYAEVQAFSRRNGSIRRVSNYGWF